METVSLDWQGPFSFNEGSKDYLQNQQVAHCPGVYLWTIEYEKSYLVYYVGRASNFGSRLDVHKKNLLSGVWLVYNPDSFAKGIKETIYNPRAGKEKFVKKDEAERMLHLFRIFVLRLDKLDRESVERAIIYHLGSHTGIEYDFLDNHQFYQPKELKGISIKFCYPEKILGMPDRITI